MHTIWKIKVGIPDYNVRDVHDPCRCITGYTELTFYTSDPGAPHVVKRSLPVGYRFAMTSYPLVNDGSILTQLALAKVEPEKG